MLKTVTNQVNVSQITGVLPVVNGGTGVTTSTGTGSTVLSDAPTLSGNVTMSTGNLIIGTAGKGIDFSADPSAPGMTSELFDDYEEGAWTPSLGGDTTYFAQSGTYTKVGRMVFVRGVLVVNAIGTGSTTQISGLPFANASGAVCAISVGSFFSSATAVTSFFASVSNGGSVINVNSLASAATTEAANAIFANSAQFQFSGCYSV